MRHSDASSDPRPVVAIAGATGFVGAALRDLLAPHYRIIGLTRSPVRAEKHQDDPDVTWRHCDLYSLLQLEEALQGVDYAIYLVHSMLPSARMVQANFADLDVILADNFARAAELNGVKQILYLGGLQPDGAEDDPEGTSKHLASRLEVEATLAGRGVPVTALRAGIVVGPGGSSLRILLNLVRRLPVMVLPKWTQSKSQPVAIEDVERAVLRCLGNEETFGQAYDIGGPEQLTYAEMIARAARALGKKRWLFPIPFLTPGLSRLWVVLVSGAPMALVGPLVESLKHSLTVSDNPVQRALLPGATSFDEALRRSIDDEGRPLPNPRKALRPLEKKSLREARTVQSVQRMPLPRGRDAEWVAFEYMRWLPRFVWPLLRADVSDDGVVRFSVFGKRYWSLLELSHAPDRSVPDRQLFYITGGLLARGPGEAVEGSPGRFEFREVLGGRAIVAAIHDFRPALPWYIYQWTQALVHLWVMNGFRGHLSQVPELLPESTAS